MKILIDTNVILDALMDREPFSEVAQRLFLKAADGIIHAYITANTVTDIFYILNKNLKDTAKTKECIQKLLALFTVIDVTEKDCQKALELPINDFEDALLAACAKRKGIWHIITRNVKDFEGSPVTAIEPDQFFAEYL